MTTNNQQDDKMLTALELIEWLLDDLPRGKTIPFDVSGIRVALLSTIAAKSSQGGE